MKKVKLLSSPAKSICMCQVSHCHEHNGAIEGDDWLCWDFGQALAACWSILVHHTNVCAKDFILTQLHVHSSARMCYKLEGNQYTCK